MSRTSRPRVAGPPYSLVRIHGTARPGLSLAVALRARSVAARVELVEAEPAARRRALDLGFATETRGSLFPDPPDLVVLSDTPSRCEEQLPELARFHPTAVFTDVASVKRPITEIAATLPGRGARFVGSHPLMSDQGPADSELPIGFPVAICPTEANPPAVIASIERLWQLLGGRPVLVSAEEHDRAMAVLDHLPVVAAGALVRAGERAMLPGSAGEHLVGVVFRELSRVAAQSPELSAETLRRNADLLAPRLGQVADELNRVAGILETATDSDGEDGLVSWLAAASRVRHRLEGE